MIIENPIQNRTVSEFMEMLSVLKSDFFIMIEIYADESGTHHPLGAKPGTEVPIIAGYMGWKKDWKKFARDWNSILAKYEVRYFHAKEFESGRGYDYLSWTDEKRQSFRYALAEIAGRFIPIGGSYHIKEHVRENPNDTNYVYRLPIKKFFEDFSFAIREWGLLSENISIVFDHTKTKLWMMEIATQIDILKNAGFKIDSHSYGDDKLYIPLQAADMLCHRSRQRHFEKLEKQIATSKSVFLPVTVYDIMLCRNLHPKIGFKPELTGEMKKEIHAEVKKFGSVKRALKSVPNNYFNIK